MKIAILGTRGIPNRYGGFESLAENLANCLTAHGHQVTVYCRRAFTTPHDKVDPRIRRVILPGLPSKHFDTLFHSFLATLHVIFTAVDVVLICNVANSPFAWIPRIFGKPTALNVDGLDRKRKKWNFLGQAFLHMCEVISVVAPTRVITDAVAVQEYYRKRYRKASTMIAYGASVPATSDGLDSFGLVPERYILYVGRLEPENSPELVIRAYGQVQTDWPLVIVGGNPYNPGYVQRLKALADPRVIFTGAVYGEGYWALQKNAAIYISGCEIGGVHPALVEAMAARNAVLFLDTPASRETTAGCAIPFRADATELAGKLTTLLRDDKLRSDLAGRAQQSALRRFGWEAITRQYEHVFTELLSGRKRS
jgi:glycosyltransferase involved in cell wall biosynthesis